MEYRVPPVGRFFFNRDFRTKHEDEASSEGSFDSPQNITVVRLPIETFCNVITVQQLWFFPNVLNELACLSVPVMTICQDLGIVTF